MVQLVIGLAQPDQHRRIEPVLCFRPVDADQQHIAVPLHSNISWLCRARQSGGCWSRLRTDGVGTSKGCGKRGGPGTGNHEVSAFHAGGCCASGVVHELPKRERKLIQRKTMQRAEMCKATFTLRTI